MPHPAVAQIWLALARVSIPTVSKVHVNVKTIPDLEIFEARLNVSHLGDQSWDQTCSTHKLVTTLHATSSLLPRSPPHYIPHLHDLFPGGSMDKPSYFRPCYATVMVVVIPRILPGSEWATSESALLQLSDVSVVTPRVAGLGGGIV
jgi:hypothetical protein